MIGLRSSEISDGRNPLLLGGVPNLVSKWILEIPSTFTKWLTNCSHVGWTMGPDHLSMDYPNLAGKGAFPYYVINRGR